MSSGEQQAEAVYDGCGPSLMLGGVQVCLHRNGNGLLTVSVYTEDAPNPGPDVWPGGDAVPRLQVMVNDWATETRPDGRWTAEVGPAGETHATHNKDADALADIASRLDCQEWDADAIADVVDILRRNGQAVREVTS